MTHGRPFLLFVICLHFLSPEDVSAEQILILHSYHHGYRWTDSVHEGIMEILGSRPDTELFVTHMDGKYFSDPALLDLFETLLSQRYNFRFDAVICTDDPALDFLLERRDRLFVDIPLVFCGTNGFDPTRIAGLGGITGVNEEISISETLDSVLALLPSTNRVVVVGDVSQAGLRNLQLVREAEVHYGDRLRFDYHEGPDPEELRRALRGYGAGTVVLYVSYLQTRSGESLGLQESLELVTSSSPVPVFGFWDFLLGHGVAGGMLVSGHAQGVAAARLVEQILAGESPDEIPVVMNSPNELQFDHPVLSRFGLDVSKLPDEAKLLNQPRSFWRENRRWILFFLGFITFESFLLVWLFISRSLLHKTQKTLAASEEKWRTYITEAPLAVFLCDNNGDYLEVNPGACGMTGYNREELLAMNLGQMLPEEFQEEGARHFDQVRETGHSDGELIKVRKDGSPYWTRVQTVRLSEDRFLAFTQDISTAKEAEKNIREARDQWKRTFDAVPDLIFLIDPEFKILKANRAFLTRLGKEAEEVLGKHCYEVVHGTQFPVTLCPNLETLGDRKGHRQEMRQLSLNGDFLITTTPLYDREETFLGSVHVARDITELKKYEQILAESEKRLRLAQEVSRLGSWEIDVATMERWWSDEIFRIFGLPSEEGVPVPEVYKRHIHPDDYLLWKRTLEKLKTGEDAEVVIRVYRSSDGEMVFVEVRGVSQLDDTGKVVRLFGTLRDITDRVRAEEDRLRLERQFQQAQKLESLGVLAGGIAHDFNNILMAILGYADLSLLDLSGASPVRTNLEEITKASRRASDLCRQMLAYSGRGRFEEEVFPIEELVDEMARLLYTSVSKKISLQIHHGNGLPPMKGDATQIRQVVMNLVINASEAVGDGEGTVTVVTSLRHCTSGDLFSSYLKQDLPEGFYLCLEVTDTGCGMDQQALERLFEPFFTTKFTGRGLGMSAVLGIVRSHGGSLSVKSEVGRGTTFTIYLPPEKALFREPSQAKAVFPSDWKGKGAALLVDDEESIRMLGTLMLEQLGFEVVTASDGIEAVEIFQREGHRFSLVLLDLTMPRMGGAETFQALRKISSEVRVIIASGFSAQEMAGQFDGQGILGMIEKPFTLKTLRDILSRGSGNPGT